MVLSPLTGPSFANSSDDSLRQGLPGRRVSGGVRSANRTCLTTPNQPVVALMPKSNVGLTLSEYPTFWFSLPAVSQDRVIEFGLLDSSGELLRKETFNASAEAGLHGLSLPKTFAPLAVNQDYQWYLSVVCNADSRSEDLVVTGWVRRVPAEASMLEKLAQATTQERWAIYKDESLWFDSLTALAMSRGTAANISASDIPNSSLSDSSIGVAQHNVEELWTEQAWSEMLASLELTQFLESSENREWALLQQLSSDN
jgi:hypothetical protein